MKEGRVLTLNIQQISDVAMRAISPRINDLHTTIQCMDLFATLGQIN